MYMVKISENQYFCKNEVSYHQSAHSSHENGSHHRSRISQYLAYLSILHIYIMYIYIMYIYIIYMSILHILGTPQSANYHYNHHII